MEPKPIKITTIRDAITQIADHDGNRVEIQLDENGNATTAGVYLGNAPTSACTLNKKQIDDLKIDLQMPAKFNWQPVINKPVEFYAIYPGPTHKIAQVCDKKSARR